MIFWHSFQITYLEVNFKSACTTVYYSTTPALVKTNWNCPPFYFTDNNIGYFNEILTTEQEMSPVFILEIRSGQLKMQKQKHKHIHLWFIILMPDTNTESLTFQLYSQHFKTNSQNAKSQKTFLLSFPSLCLP